MSPPLTACKTVVFCGLAAALLATASAQVLVPQADESPLSEQMEGDQVFPSLCLCPGGGYAVWQDSKIDRYGQGVAAVKLGPDLRPSGLPFVISQRRTGHQEHPGAAMLADGGTAFAWLGPNHSSPDVYARFMTADGTFRTGDIQLNPPTRLVKSNHYEQVYGYKNNKLRNLKFRMTDAAKVYRDRNQSPAVVALPDGGALVTYAGWRRLHTNWMVISNVVKYSRGRSYTNDLPQKRSTSQDWMLDVFFQRFSADGKKVGGEVQVNQFAKYNQRHPSVAVLPSGNFVVTWVSENFVPLPIEATHARVDIMGRVFSPTGEPLGNEFIVNSTRQPSASPAVSPLSDGRFTIVWAGRDGVRNNGWDIYARVFGPSGVPAGEALRLNEHTYGDQFSPRISSLGGNQLVVWSSLGQDMTGERTVRRLTPDGTWSTWGLGVSGSWQSVYGRLLTDGAPAGTEFRVNTTLGKKLHPQISGDGMGQFLVTWSAFGEGTGFDLYSKTIATTQAAANAMARLSPAGAGNVNRVGAPATGALAGAAVGSGSIAVTTGTSVPVTLAGPLEKLRLTWRTESGARYQVQTSTNLVNWSDTGAPRVGSGGTDTAGVAASGTAAFYRVVKTP